VLEDPFLKDFIDEDRVGFVGYSLGGMTGLSLGGAKAENVKEVIHLQQRKYQELAPELVEQVDFSEASGDFRDPRIKAMVLLCPAAFVHPPHTLKGVKIPVGLVAAVNDQILPHQDHAVQIIEHVKPGKVKVMKKEVGHHTFLNCPSSLGKRMLHEAISKDHESCNREKVHKEVGNFTVSFFNENLKR
jgi:predicted dienelactone hydrolase